MNKYVIIFLFSFASSLYGQNISFVKQSYIIRKDNMGIDTICNLIYKVRNASSNSLVVMFTEDDINSLPLNKLIKRKMYRRYGDFSLSQFVWDNIENHCVNPIIPDFFIKILSPNESFDIILLLQNEDDNVVDSYFRNHILICNIEDIDNKEMFYGFKNSVIYHNLKYSYFSITLLWYQFADWIHMRNFRSSK